MNEDASLPLLPTQFAPAERVTLDQAREKARALVTNPVVQAILDACAGYVLILDEHRQILAANAQVSMALELAACDAVWGRRPGEALRCMHAGDGPGGCGTGLSCRSCGAVLSILAAQTTGEVDTRECLLTMGDPGHESSGEFRVRSTPLDLGGERYTVVVLQDISALKRKEVLETVFFHDVLNLVGGLQGATYLLKEEPQNSEELALQIMDLSNLLAQEILSQRLLMSAERGDLAVQNRPVRPAAVLEDLRKVFQTHEVASGRRLVIEPAGEGQVSTDPVLLGRVLVNMLKNAFEAAPIGTDVTFQVQCQGGCPTFTVHNEGAIPEEVQERIFQRSFSTKAVKGRGLGTYSMKVFGERYLGGKVSFTSSVADGTSFSFTLPAEACLHLPDRESEAPKPQAVPVPHPTASPVPSPGTADRAHPGKGRLLLVDDSRTILTILSKILGDDHEVRTASDGASALAVLADWIPDLVLLDVVMPGMDGLEVCSRLRKDSRTADVPVIFLSAMSDEADEAIGLQLGAIDYIHKPINPSIVQARIRNHLDLKRYRDTLKDMSFMDGLTAISNRRRFEEYFEQEWRRAQRQEVPISLAMVDVDHFKRFNDRYGHLQGDACLKSVAGALQGAMLRTTDLVARYGGEEFAVVMPDTDDQGALKVAERMLEAVRSLGLLHADSPTAPTVTVSIGIATRTPARQAPRVALQHEADRMLYEAKQSGRNQVRA